MIVRVSSSNFSNLLEPRIIHKIVSVRESSRTKLTRTLLVRESSRKFEKFGVREVRVSGSGLVGNWYQNDKKFLSVKLNTCASSYLKIS